MSGAVLKNQHAYELSIAIALEEEEAFEWGQLDSVRCSFSSGSETAYYVCFWL